MISYDKLPDFPVSTVHGHAGELILGHLAGVPVVCMKGRGHFYEGRGMNVMTYAIRTFKLLGCELLFSTNAAGSLEGFPLHEGVFVSYPGPNFETAAEIRMMQIMGDDVVGMPEDHRLVSEPSIALSELQNEYFVTMPSAHSDWAFLHRVCQRAGFSPMIVREAVEPQTVLAMVSMGMGITLTADSRQQWPGVVFRPLQERVPADLYVVYDEKQATPAVKKLVNTLVGG